MFLFTILIVLNWHVGSDYEIFGADIPWRSKFFFSNFEVISSHFGLNELMAPHYARVPIASLFKFFYSIFGGKYALLMFYSFLIWIYWCIASSIFSSFLKLFEYNERFLSVIIGFLFTFGPIGFFYLIRLQNNFFFPLAVLASYSLIFQIFSDKDISSFEKLRWLAICGLNFPLSYQPPLIIAGFICLIPFVLTLSAKRIKQLFFYSCCLVMVGMPGILVHYFFGIVDGKKEFASEALINWVSKSSSLNFVLGNIADIGWHEMYFPSWHFLIHSQLSIFPMMSALALLALLFLIPNFLFLRWRILISVGISILGSTGTYYSDLYLKLAEHTFIWAVRAPWQKFFVFAECWYFVILCAVVGLFKKEHLNDFGNWLWRFGRKRSS